MICDRCKDSVEDPIILGATYWHESFIGHDDCAERFLIDCAGDTEPNSPEANAFGCSCLTEPLRRDPECPLHGHAP